MMKKRQGGVTLIEAIVTIVFIGIALPPLLFALSTILDRSISTETMTKAVLVAQSEMEFMLVQRTVHGYAHITQENFPDKNVPTCYMPGQQYWDIPYGPEEDFRIKVQIDEDLTGDDLNIVIQGLARDETGQLVPFDLDPPYQPAMGFKRITVSVHPLINEQEGPLMAQLYYIVNQREEPTLWNVIPEE